MDGFKLDISYVEERNRLKALFTPILILPLFILLLFWSQPSFFGDMGLGFDNNADGDYIIKTKEDFVQTMSDKIEENHESYSHSSSFSYNVGSALGAFIADYIQPAVFEMKEMHGDTLTRFLVFFSIFFIFWILMLLLIMNISYCFIIFLPVIFIMLFCKKYPSWVFSWNKEITRYMLRVTSYFLVLTPKFPDFEKDEDVILTLPEPKVDNLNRVLPLIKWLLILPHSIILSLLTVIVIPASFIAYIITFITGNYPRSIFNLVEGYLRWNYRVICYSHLLCTDEYPQFSFRGECDKP